MTQSQNQSKTTFTQSQNLKRINLKNRRKKLLGNKRLLVRYKRYRSLDLQKGKLTNYWDQQIRKLEKMISENSD